MPTPLEAYQTRKQIHENLGAPMSVPANQVEELQALTTYFQSWGIQVELRITEPFEEYIGVETVFEEEVADAVRSAFYQTWGFITAPSLENLPLEERVALACERLQITL